MQGIGNGLPLAAVVTTPEIAQTLSQRIHFNTYGGNPVSSAAGRAVLRAVDEDGLQANCAKVSRGSPSSVTSLPSNESSGQRGSLSAVLALSKGLSGC